MGLLTRDQVRLLCRNLGFKRQKIRRSPLGFGVKQREAFVQQLLIAVELFDARGQLLDLLLFKASPVSCPVGLELDCRRSISQLRQIILGRAGLR